MQPFAGGSIQRINAGTHGCVVEPKYTDREGDAHTVLLTHAFEMQVNKSNAGHRQNAARHCEEFVRGILRPKPSVLESSPALNVARQGRVAQQRHGQPSRQPADEAAARKAFINWTPSDRKPTSYRSRPTAVDADSDFGDTQITTWAIDFWLRRGLGNGETVLLRRVTIARTARSHREKYFFERFKLLPGTCRRPARTTSEDGPPGAAAIEAVTAASHATVLKHKQWRAAVEGRTWPARPTWITRSAACSPP